MTGDDEPRYRIIDRLTGLPEGPYTVQELLPLANTLDLVEWGDRWLIAGHHPALWDSYQAVTIPHRPWLVRKIRRLRNYTSVRGGGKHCPHWVTFHPLG
jgi:hypothetical protein